MKSFYLFEGSWFDVFDKLAGMIQPNHGQRFSIWESKIRTDTHLLIVYGTQLDSQWQRHYNINGITESDFQTYFQPKMKAHIIHGYNEFKDNSRPIAI